MASKVQLVGGSFQDALGVVLAEGYLLFRLSQDAATVDGVQVAAGHTVKINLGSDGSVLASPAQLIWPNDVLVPTGTFYNVEGYDSDGQLVWGPNAQQVFSTPSPFDISVWVPGSVSVVGGVTSILLQTDGDDNGSQTKLNLVPGTNISIVDDGTGDITITATGGGSGGGDVFQNPTGSQVILQPNGTLFVMQGALAPGLGGQPAGFEIASDTQYTFGNTVLPIYPSVIVANFVIGVTNAANPATMFVVDAAAGNIEIDLAALSALNPWQFGQVYTFKRFDSTSNSNVVTLRTIAGTFFDTGGSTYSLPNLGAITFVYAGSSTGAGTNTWVSTSKV